MSLTIDIRQELGGYSCGKRFENEDIFISLGKENTNRQVAIVELKQLNLEIIGNENLYDRAERFIDRKTSEDDFLCEVLELVNLTYSRLMAMNKASYEAGKAVGAAELKSKFRELML